MTADYDVAILGAGLAGLSLAVRLAELPAPPRILLVDRRTDYARDRTWCHWATAPHPFTASVSHRWHEWDLRCGPRIIQRGHPAFAYERIPADLFYAEALARLAATGTVERRLGVEVLKVVPDGEGATVTLAGGPSLRVRQVYDSRPRSAPPGRWRQIFRGLELRGKRNDSTRVTLMDFRSAGPAGARFFYVLPLSPDTLLVEDTWITRSGEDPVFDDAEILNYARERFGEGEWTCLHREEGVIPMRVEDRPSAPRSVIFIGTAGGAVRPSSGYAFTRIQRQSAALAEAYAQGCAQASQPRLPDWFDHVFLRAIDREPERMPEFMLALFERVPAERLLRFMESHATLLDLWAIISSLPAWPFIRACATLRR